MTLSPTDSELLTAADHDAAAFRELYDRYAERIHAFFVARTHDRDAALDLTAETFAQMWRSRHRFEDRCGGTIGPWVFAIARHTLVRSVRAGVIATRAREALKLDLTTTPAMAPPSDAWLSGLDDEIADALASLPDGQRRAVTLRILEGREYDDVASAMDCSPTAVRIKVSRGLHSVRQHLGVIDG